jgi:hypothetical protein
MKAHTAKYLAFALSRHGLDHWECFCEITGYVSMGLDVCHIDPRGMGGNPKGDKDRIENLMMMTRTLHTKTEGQPAYDEHLRYAHNLWIQTGRPLFETDNEYFKEHFEKLMPKP